MEAEFLLLETVMAASLNNPEKAGITNDQKIKDLLGWHESIELADVFHVKSIVLYRHPGTNMFYITKNENEYEK